MTEMQLTKGYTSLLAELKLWEQERPTGERTGITLFYSVTRETRGQSKRLIAQMEHIVPLFDCHTSIIKDPDQPKIMITLVGQVTDLVKVLELAIRMQQRDEHGR